jgi:hypothetical protein
MTLESSVLILSDVMTHAEKTLPEYANTDAVTLMRPPAQETRKSTAPTPSGGSWAPK